MLGGNLSELLHALRLSRVHASLQNILKLKDQKSRIKSETDQYNTKIFNYHRDLSLTYLIEIVALEEALVADL